MNRARTESNRETVRSFGTFLESWMTRQNQHLADLLSAAEDPQTAVLEDLIRRVLAHYQQYYDQKSRVAGDNVLILFGPPWLTRSEKAMLWVAGFKPCMAVQLAASSVGDLSEEQRRELDQLMVTTRMEEKALDDEMAMIQESLAAPPLLQESRRGMRALRDGEAQEAVEAVKAALEETVADADLLRTRTAITVVDLLTPAQGVKFLAAAARLQLQLHSCELERER